MRVFLVRHGETEWNIQRRMQGWENSPLTQKGIDQAKEHGKLLNREGVEFLFSSDLERVVQTVDLIRENCIAPTSQHTELRECSMGAWEGFHIDEIKSRWATEYKHWREGDDSVPPPQGESLNMVKARVQRVVDKVLASHYECVAFVTHGLTTRVLLDLLLKLTQTEIESLRIYNDVVHLISGPLGDPQVSHYIGGCLNGAGICTTSR